MFELIEEDLKNEQAVPAAQESEVMQSRELGEIAVSVMPERFRPVIKKKKKGSFVMIIVVVLFVLIAIASVVALLFLSQPQKKAEQKPVESTSELQKEQQAPPVQQSEVATSTPLEIPFQQTPSQPQQPVTTPQQPQNQEVTPLTPPSQTTAPLIQGLDTDGDTLTDAEERMYGADPQKPDTDGDGFFDGEELKKLFDPTKQGAQLSTSTLVHTYTNQPFKYRVLYPAAWVAKAVNSTEREVIFTSATGEFISLKVEDNPQSLSPLDWYITTKEPGVNPSQLQSVVGDTWTGITSSDGRSVYMVRRAEKGVTTSSPLMYSLTYNLNAKNEVNFLDTFQMMIASFTFTDLTFIK